MQGKKDIANKTQKRIQREPKGFKLGYKQPVVEQVRLWLFDCTW